MAGPSQARKPPSANDTARKPSSELTTASTGTRASQLASSAHAITLEPKNARTHLEIQGILDKDAKLNFDVITVALLNAADNTLLSEDSLRTTVRALAYVGQQYTQEFIAQQTIDFLIRETARAHSLGKETANKEVDEVRQSLESAKSALAEEISSLAEEKSSWSKAMEDLTSLKETFSQLRTTVEERTKETVSSLGEVKIMMEKATDEMRIEKFYAGGNAPQPHATQSEPLWGEAGHAGYAGYTNSIGGNTSYAQAVAAPPPGFRHENEFQQQHTLDRLRGSEGKRDRQLMLDAEDLGTGSILSLNDKSLLEKIEETIQTITADELYPAEESGIIRCDKVTRLARGGILILMNSEKAKLFLEQPDISERFAQLLGVTSKLVPRKFKVVMEKVPTSTDLDDPKLPRRIESENGVIEGDLIGLKWIKTPSRWAPNQRHAHIVAEFRTKTSANMFIGQPRFINHSVVYSSKYNTDGFRCFKCQKPGHKSAVCQQPFDTCGTCAKKHRTDRCDSSEHPHCVTCDMPGHATWNRQKCPKYFTTNDSQSMHIADRHYKYYVTDEEWTWEPASKVSSRPIPVRRSVPITELIKRGRNKGNTRPSSRASARDRPDSPGLRQTTLPFTSTPPRPPYSPCKKTTPGPISNNGDTLPTTQVTDEFRVPSDSTPSVENIDV